MTELLDREAILRLFTELADRLRRRGVRANVYVFGGAAIALLFDDRRVTRDIDTVVLEGHGRLIEEVRSMARERGLPSTWLNEQAAMYVSRQSDNKQATVFDHPNLQVAAASAEHLLAMKLVAARQSDAADIALLLKALDLNTVAAAEAVLRQVFPDRPLSDRARLVVEDLLDRST